MNKTDKFFPDGEWSEEAYEKHMVEEATLLAERKIAPWQPAMREWLKDGCPFPTLMLRMDTRRCALAIYCRGKPYEKAHGYSPCEDCPYGRSNFDLFKDLSRALGEFRAE